MNDGTNTETESRDADIYLPAVKMTPNFGRIEEAVADLFDFHGVVLIPDSYNN